LFETSKKGVPLWLLKEVEKHSFSTRLFNNACDLGLTVPAYVLQVSLDGRFREEIIGVLIKKLDRLS
jgi:hypothetical protein